MSILPSFWRPVPVAFLFTVVASALCSPASAQEAWCIANAANCVMSEPFQSTTYTTTQSGANFALFTGDQSGSKIGLMNQPASGSASISVQDTGSNTFAGNFLISTDAALLALLPNRNATSVARFLRALEGFSGAIRFGYAPIPLGTTVKRIALRWYSYHSPVYDFKLQNSCTNGKIAHSSHATWGAAPIFTFESYGSETHEYSFINTGNWIWTGHSSFDGIVGGNGTHPGAAFNLNNWKGKWYRHEIVVRRPRTADSGGGLGYDFQFFTKNVTDNTAEVEDTRFSSGCTGCLFDGGVTGSNFVWNTGTYPTVDMSALHTEFYRAGTCQGWQGWLYVVVAKWDTDTNQRIGGANEVEGGLRSPGNLRVQ